MDTAATGSQADEAAAPAANPNAYPGEIRYNPRARPNLVVEKWQGALISRAYSSLRQDGICGRKTAAAIIDWQTRRPQARNVDGVGRENMWYDLVLNPRPYQHGPCGSVHPPNSPLRGQPLCMGRCQMPAAADAGDETEVDVDELVEMYDLENLIANYLPNGDDEQ